MAELSIQAQIAEAHKAEAERAAFAVKERARLELEELEKATAPSKPVKAATAPAEAKAETAPAITPAPVVTEAERAASDGIKSKK